MVLSTTPEDTSSMHACMSLSLWSWRISADNTSWQTSAEKKEKEGKRRKKKTEEHFISQARKGLRGKSHERSGFQNSLRPVVLLFSEEGEPKSLPWLYNEWTSVLTAFCR
jgi:hypothetical protein